MLIVARGEIVMPGAGLAEFQHAEDSATGRADFHFFGFEVHRVLLVFDGEESFGDLIKIEVVLPEMGG
jgi:hypothetical protein